MEKENGALKLIVMKYSEIIEKFIGKILYEKYYDDKYEAVRNRLNETGKELMVILANPMINDIELSCSLHEYFCLEVKGGKTTRI